MLAIECVDLCRQFTRRRQPRVTALENVNLTLGEGETVALLGSNGAGKTTLTRILATLLVPSSGTARVFETDVSRHPRRARELATAVFGGERGFYGPLSGWDNLKYFGTIAGVGARELSRRMPELLESVGLESAARRAVETYSKGMKQRLHIAVALVQKPRLLLLDEPSVGLDPEEAARLRHTIAGLQNDGVAIVLTSHNLQDIEALAPRVIMLRAGRITYDLPIRDFRSLAGAESFLQLWGTRGGERVRVEVPVADWSQQSLDTLVARAGLDSLGDLRVRTASLEEAFAAANEGSSS